MENQNNEATLVVQGTGDVASAVDRLAGLGNLADLKPAYSLIQEYLKLEVGQRERGVYAGLCEVEFTDEETGESRKVEAVRLVTQEADGSKKLKIHAGANLVSNLKRSGVAPGTPIEILFREAKKDGKKTINIFDVYALG